MRIELFDALPYFEFGRRWRCRGDRDGKRDGDGEGDGDGNGEGEGDGDGEGEEEPEMTRKTENQRRLRYLKEEGDIEINNVPCVIG
jgi:hypothetical protein